MRIKRPWQAAQDAETGARDDPVHRHRAPTERAAIGDQRWRRLLDRHDEVTGDGVLATFDAPNRALRCAFALIDALGDVGIEIRSAIPTGEIEIRDNDVRGIGVQDRKSVV